MDGKKRIKNDDVNIVASTKRKIVSNKCESESPLFDDVHAAYKSLKAETIEVIPEIIPFDDSEYEHDNNDDDDDDCDDDDDNDDDDNNVDFDEHNRNGIEKTRKSMRNFYDYNDNEQEDFDEYGYQVKWNGPSEPILFDNSEIRKMDMTDDDDYDEDDDIDEAGNVILIESEEDEGSGESDSLRASGSLNADGSTSDTGGDRKMYECDICARKVASSYNLKRHMMIHTGEKPYGCDICCRRFREFSDLKKHRRVHSTEKQFKCMTCHRNPPSATNATKCTMCESTEAAQKSQEMAMEQIIPRFDGNKKAFVCNYCNRVFGSSSNLKRHIMIHTGEKPFTCNICQRSFREMSTLKKHSFTHRNHMAALAAVIPILRAPSPPLKCYVCPKSFTDANQFKQHVLSHSDAQHDLPEITMKPVTVQQPTLKIYQHKCPKCNEIFYESSNLMLHICSVHSKVNGTMSAINTTSTAKMTLTNTVSKAVTSLRKPASSPPPLIPINRTTFAARMHQMSVGDTIRSTVVQYFCKICSKKFRSQQHLHSHQLTHKN